MFRQISPEPDLVPAPAALILGIGRVRIALDTRFDPALLRRVIEALS
ncbi:MAG: hypothetical protein HC888_17815 [Candidatus Competibacteraceae bacterium]|nr:hypothetical protein [Candidatus Competibacteraceae bacterium]